PPHSTHCSRAVASSPRSAPASMVSTKPKGETMTITIKTAAAAGFAVCALALSGCGFVADQIEDRVVDGVEGVIEDNTGVDIELGDDAQVPESFPDTIPLPDGDVVTAFGSS